MHSLAWISYSQMTSNSEVILSFLMYMCHLLCDKHGIPFTVILGVLMLAAAGTYVYRSLAAGKK